MARNDDISKLIEKLDQPKKHLAYIICLVQGLLQSRQSLTCNGLQKWLPWGTSCIIQCLNSIIQFKSEDLNNLVAHLIKVVYF